MTAYYNEHDPFAASWLRELIADNLIAPGEVDERSIEDVTPDDLRPFQQCHFFAGIGIWSLAARRVGIPDDAPLWSGSCPCQPFSAAGKGEGFDDERHLWPAFHYLIEQCRPPLVVGEQVAGADGDTWFDLVSADLDATAYAFGVAETVACGFGAPHKRSRNYWMAVPNQSRLEGLAHPGAARPWYKGATIERDGTIVRLAHADSHGRDQGRGGVAATGHDGAVGDGAAFGVAHPGHGTGRDAGKLSGQTCENEGTSPGQGRNVIAGAAAHCGSVERLAGATGSGWQRREASSQGGFDDGQATERQQGQHGIARGDETVFHRPDRPGPTNGLWADPDWLLCRDEKWRPVESGTFPLADAGAFRNRVGLLRGAGNAITLGQAEGFLRAVVGSITR